MQCNEKKFKYQPQYDKDKLYSSMTDLKYEDLFSNQISGPKFEKMDKLEKLQKMRRKGTVHLSVHVASDLRMDTKESSVTDGEDKVPKSPVWHKRSKSHFMKKVNDSYKMFQGTDIDRQLFVESIIDYLENDIDEMNEKFNSKRMSYKAK